MSGFLGMFVGGTGVPSAPTIGTATAGNGQATVTFTAPSSDGGSPILDYRVTSSPGGITATGSGSPITITGLSNGTAYTFTVEARNANGYSLSSTSSNQVTPVVPPITASGGSYIYDGTGSFTGYRFHVFTSPGTFTVTSNDGNKAFASVLVGGGGSAGQPATSSSNGMRGGGGGQVSDVTGISLTLNTAYPVSVGIGGTYSVPAPSPGYRTGGTSSWNGYGAGGGGSGYYDNGNSGSGYSGGQINRPSVEGGGVPMGGGGGAGAGANGNDSRYWYATLNPAYPNYYAPKGYPTPYDVWHGGFMGGGGIGVTSSIDGVKYGGGGGGGPTNNPTYSNGAYTPEYSPGDFLPYGGGAADSAGSSSTGGGAGGNPAGTVRSVNGGPGIVVIRYPYP